MTTMPPPIAIRSCFRRLQAIRPRERPSMAFAFAVPGGAEGASSTADVVASVLEVTGPSVMNAVPLLRPPHGSTSSDRRACSAAAARPGPVKRLTDPAATYVDSCDPNPRTRVGPVGRERRHEDDSVSPSAGGTLSLRTPARQVFERPP